MPARSVVIEKLTKFTGEHHTFLTPGEYTQLTGRAGRRGIDTVGDAVVLWSPFVPFDQVAALATVALVRAALGLPADLQHGRQPRALVLGRGGPPPAQPVVRAVPGRPRGGAGGGPAGAPPGGAGRPPRRRRQPLRRHRRVPPAAGRRALGGPGRAARRGGGRGGPHRGGPGPAATGRRRHARQGSPRRSGGRADQRPAQELGSHGCGASPRSRVQLPLSAQDFDEPPRVVGRIELPTPFTPEPPELPARGGPGAGAGQADHPRAGRRPRRTSRQQRAGRPSRHRRPRPGRPAAGRRPGRPGGPGGRRPADQGEGPQREPGPALRPCAAHPRGLGRARRLAAHRVG